MGFASHLRGQITRVQKEISFKINYLAYILFTKIVQKSPHVGEGPYVAGHFINNWFPAVNTFDTSTTTSVDPDGKGSLERIDAVVKTNTFFQRDGFISLSNNLSYSWRVELLGWPKGYDPATGWNWTGKRMIYAPVAHSMLWIKTKI